MPEVQRAAPRLRAAARREAILDTAAALFAERSADAVSMSDIVRAAGVSRPVVYDHFQTKRELIIALVLRHHEAVVASLEQLIAGGGIRSEDDYRRVLDGMFEHFAADPAGWRLLCGEPAADPAIAEVQRRTRDEILALTVRALHLSQRDVALAEGLRHAVNGLFAWGRDHPQLSRDQLVDAAVGLTWHGLTP